MVQENRHVLIRQIALIPGTGFGVGFVRLTPGTLGSLPGLLLIWMVLKAWC